MTEPMPAAPLPSISDPDFRAETIMDGRSLRVGMKGTADLNTQKALEVFLANVHACAIVRGATTVVMDMRDLEFMNSSCLKRMVNWIFVARAEPTESRYQIVLVPQPKALWQKRSLQALSLMAPELVSVTP